MLSDVGHVVVVDDDPSLRQMVIRYLEDHNVPAKPASNKTELNRHLTAAVPVVNSIVLAVDRESRDAGTRCWICVD